LVKGHVSCRWGAGEEASVYRSDSSGRSIRNRSTAEACKDRNGYANEIRSSHIGTEEASNEKMRKNQERSREGTEERRGEEKRREEQEKSNNETTREREREREEEIK
jgi:hypothetical protein